jgi:uncharacterized protein YjbI with pentapeptide repeats
MANDDHISRLKQGVAAWNAWREENPNIRPDLREANLIKANLREVDFKGADLSEAALREADLVCANLSTANLSAADLTKANLAMANLGEANLREANLVESNLSGADLGGANLSSADLYGAELMEANLFQANLSKAALERANLNAANLFQANLSEANLRQAYLSVTKLMLANLSGANITGANLYGANLSGANLKGASLQLSILVDTVLTAADLTGCYVFGISTWNLHLEGAKQQNLVITQNMWLVDREPEITVDNIEVAQFVYLMLHNEKIRDVIDTITAKAVLILGRFTDERKAVLDALRDELRKRDYLPILFDFAIPATRDITETVPLLARMSRFIIADLTDPSSIPKELEAIVPGLAVPVQPLLEGSARPYAMFKDYWKYEWVLPVYRYEGLEPLLATLAEKVIAPAEGKVQALAERRRMIEAELTKPQ